MAHGDLKGVPGGAQVWRIDGRVHIAYTIPGTDVPILFHVERLEQLSDLFEGGEARFDRDITQAEANRAGAVPFGVSSMLDPSLGEHPWDSFLARIEQDIDINPWLTDPEVLAHVAASWLRGEAPNLERTEWWKAKTDAERKWIARAAGNPTQARLEQQETRDRTREQLIGEGWPDQNPPDSLVNFIADQFVTGEVSEEGWGRLIRQQVDPSAPGASPFAGRPAVEGAATVRTGDGVFVRTPDGRFVRVDEATAARFADLGELGAAGDRNVEQSGDPAAVRERVAAIRRNAGLPDDPDSDQVWVDRILGGSATLGDARLRINEKAIQTLGVSEDAEALFGAVPEGRTALGGEEDVLALIRHWVGPHHAQRYGQDYIAQWAGRIRNNEAAREQLVDELRGLAATFFPNWNEGTAFAAMEPWYNAQYEQMAGFRPDQENDPFYMSLLQHSDPSEVAAMLREQARAEEWEPAMRQVVGTAMQRSGGTARQVV